MEYLTTSTFFGGMPLQTPQESPTPRAGVDVDGTAQGGASEFPVGSSWMTSDT